MATLAAAMLRSTVVGSEVAPAMAFRAVLVATTVTLDAAKDKQKRQKEQNGQQIALFHVAFSPFLSTLFRLIAM